jgi:protein-tyrosine phosphatase
MEDIREAYGELKKILATEVPELTLHLGAEILCLPQTEELADAHRLPTLAGTDYVLTEFYFDETFTFMDSALEQITKNGYRIVVAHPERYMVFQRRPELLEKWADKGYVLQMNKGSILGLFGSRVRQAAHEILGRGLVHLVASDGHSCTQRTPHMGKIDSWAQRYCTASYAKMLLTDNPGHILRGETVERL